MPYASVWMATKSTAANIAASAPSRLRTSPDEQRDVPCDEEQRAENARFHAELRVVGLAGLERYVLAERDLARVAEAVALRVVQDGADAVAQSRQGATRRTARRREAAVPCSVRLRALIRELYAA